MDCHCLTAAEVISMKNDCISDYPYDIRLEENDGLRYYRLQYRDFPDVFGTGETIEEAIECGKEALETEFIYRQERGIKTPEPKPISLDEGVTGRITLRMPKSLHSRIIELANDDDVSLNTEIVAMLSLAVGSKSLKRASKLKKRGKKMPPIEK